MHLTNLEQLAIQVVQKTRNNPLWYHQEILKRNLWTKEVEIIRALNNHREVAVRSCNASGKTYTAGGIVHEWLTKYPMNSVVLTTAPTGRQVKEILWREIKSAIPEGYYPKDAITETKINLGPKWFAIGLSTDKPDQFQGFHSEHLLAIVDEGSGVPDVIYEAIDGCKPEKMLVLGNPMRNTGRFAQMFKDSAVKKIHISAYHTPNIEQKKTIIPGLITQEDIDKFIRIYGEDSDVVKIRVKGDFPEGSDSSFISVESIANAMTRIVIPAGRRKLGVDIAYGGSDLTVFVTRQGNKVIKTRKYPYLENTMAIAGYVIQAMKEDDIAAEDVFIDVIGWGAGTCDRLLEQRYKINKVWSSETANDEDQFANVRVEIWDGMREWLKTGQLPNDDVWYELCNFKKMPPNSRGQTVLESKEAMKKRNSGLKSPNYGDALSFTFYVAPPQEKMRVISPEQIAKVTIGDYD